MPGQLEVAGLELAPRRRPAERRAEGIGLGHPRGLAGHPRRDQRSDLDGRAVRVEGAAVLVAAVGPGHRTARIEGHRGLRLSDGRRAGDGQDRPGRVGQPAVGVVITDDAASAEDPGRGQGQDGDATRGTDRHRVGRRTISHRRMSSPPPPTTRRSSGRRESRSCASSSGVAAGVVAGLPRTGAPDGLTDPDVVRRRDHVHHGDDDHEDDGRGDDPRLGPQVRAGRGPEAADDEQEHARGTSARWPRSSLPWPPRWPGARAGRAPGTRRTSRHRDRWRRSPPRRCAARRTRETARPSSTSDARTDRRPA